DPRSDPRDQSRHPEVTGSAHGIDTQRHPLRSKTHASSRAQKPSHEGESASPHGVVRHSQAPPDTTAEQWPPLLHVPSHLPSLNSHDRVATVVVVVDGTPVPGLVVVVGGGLVVGTHSSCARLKSMTRWPPNSSVFSAAGGNGRG